MTQQPQAVVFDVGRVLITWDPEGFYDRVIGRERRERLFAEIDLHAANSVVDRGGPWRQTFVDLAARYPHWADEIMLWHERWSEMTLPTIEHSARLLRALRRKGVPVFALTNFGRETFAHGRRHHPVLNEFDVAVVSGELGTTKPDPRIYAHLESVTGLSGQALLFADDLPANIATASARGWRTHLFTEPTGWAERLVAEGLLAPDDAA